MTSASSSIAPTADGKHQDLADRDFAPRADQRMPALSPAGSVSITSMRPVGFSLLAAQRAAGVEARGNHAAVIEHQQIAGLSSEGNSENRESRNAPVARSITSIRLCPRSAGGCCAISSSGSSKSKSVTRRSLIRCRQSAHPFACLK